MSNSHRYSLPDLCKSPHGTSPKHQPGPRYRDQHSARPPGKYIGPVSVLPLRPLRRVSLPSAPGAQEIYRSGLSPRNSSLPPSPSPPILRPIQRHRRLLHTPMHPLKALPKAPSPIPILPLRRQKFQPLAHHTQLTRARRSTLRSPSATST